MTFLVINHSRSQYLLSDRSTFNAFSNKVHANTTLVEFCLSIYWKYINYRGEHWPTRSFSFNTGINSESSSINLQDTYIKRSLHLGLLQKKDWTKRHLRSSRNCALNYVAEWEKHMHFPPSQSIVIAITLMFNCNNWLCFASIPFHKSTSIFAGLSVPIILYWWVV